VPTQTPAIVSSRSPARGDAAPADHASPAPALRDHVARAVRRYLADLDGHSDGMLHGLVLREVETPLLAEVMRHCDGNLTRASAILGINRATLRKRLRELGLSTD
jgi:Fis family transcriptional regulator, factor for inversion stimulation protein